MKFARDDRETKGPVLQVRFLNALRKERVPVSIYLMNGIKLQGVIESFDQFAILLRGLVSQMVFKHAISTVVPARNFSAWTPPVAETEKAVDLSAIPEEDFLEEAVEALEELEESEDMVGGNR